MQMQVLLPVRNTSTAYRGRMFCGSNREEEQMLIGVSDVEQ